MNSIQSVRRWGKWYLFVIFAGALLCLPLFFGTYFVFVFSVICVYIIVAFGMNILC
jgi:hypothetical protein